MEKGIDVITFDKKLDGQNWLALMDRQTWLEQIRKTNQYTENLGWPYLETDTYAISRVAYRIK